MNKRMMAIPVGDEAEDWVRTAARAVGDSWVEPLVNVSSEGDVVLEWWHEHRKLTVYISPDGAEYVRVWGPDIHEDMDDGDASPATNFPKLWAWLTGRS